MSGFDTLLEIAVLYFLPTFPSRGVKFVVFCSVFGDFQIITKAACFRLLCFFTLAFIKMVVFLLFELNVRHV